MNFLGKKSPVELNLPNSDVPWIKWVAIEDHLKTKLELLINCSGYLFFKIHLIHVVHPIQESDIRGSSYDKARYLVILDDFEEKTFTDFIRQVDIEFRV